MMKTALGLALILAACSDGDTSNKTPDAASNSPDAANNVVASEVPCAGATLSGTVTVPGFAYMPEMTMINVDQVVKLEASGSHDFNSQGKGFDVAFGQTKCFKFTKTGTHVFKCTPHSFTGKIIVQ